MKVRLSSWVGAQYVDLIDVLQMLGENRWRWRIEDFVGLLKPGSGSDARELEARLVRGGALLLSWPELVSFAEEVHQMIEGRLVAFGREGSAPVLVVDCVDSSVWALAATDGDATALEALTRVAGLWPTGD